MSDTGSQQAYGRYLLGAHQLVLGFDKLAVALGELVGGFLEAQ